MEWTDAAIGAWVGKHLWPLFRVASFLAIVPVIGTQLVPMRIRLGLAFLITLAIVPLLPPVPQVDALSGEAMIISLHQILIGSALGFTLLVLMQVFSLMGMIISMQMGFGFASMMDPANGVSVSVISQFYLITVTLLYLAMNGHLVAIEVMVESFNLLPISTDGLSSGGWHLLAHRITWMFAAALLLALPAVTALLIVNLSFGVMTRAAPQMNVFALGFPIGLLFGLFTLWVIHGGMLPHFQALSEDTFAFMREIQAR